MSTLPLLIILLIMLIYLDYSIWYSAEMHNICNEKKREFRGVLWRLWDFID